MRNRVVLYILAITSIFLSSISLLPAQDKQINWELYSMGTWRIRFYIPQGINLSPGTSGDWATLTGRSSNDIEINAQVKRVWLPVEDIEEEALKRLKLKKQDIALLDSGIRNVLNYRVYQATENLQNKKSVKIIFIANHQHQNFSYLVYLTVPPGIYEQNKEDFKFWYTNLYGS